MIIRKGIKSILTKEIKKGNLKWLIKNLIKISRLRMGVKFFKSGRTISPPLILHLFSTNECNLSCRKCSFYGPDKQAISNQDMKAIILEAKELGVNGISFTGGEPLTRTDIPELIKKTKKLNMHAMLVSNGTMLDKFMDEILESKVDVIMVSLDGSRAEIHDDIRGLTGAFEKTISNLDKLSKTIKKFKYNTDIAVSTVIRDANIENIDALLRLCAQMGVNRVVLCPEHDFDAKKNKTIISLKKHNGVGKYLLAHPLRHLIGNSDAYLKNLDRVLAKQKSSLGCSATYTTMFIDSKSRIYACKSDLALGRYIWDLKTHRRPLKEIWYSDDYNKQRVNCRQCQKCYMSVNRELDVLFS